MRDRHIIPVTLSPHSTIGRAGLTLFQGKGEDLSIGPNLTHNLAELDIRGRLENARSVVRSLARLGEQGATFCVREFGEAHALSIGHLT